MWSVLLLHTSSSSRAAWLGGGRPTLRAGGPILPRSTATSQQPSLVSPVGPCKRERRVGHLHSPSVCYRGPPSVCYPVCATGGTPSVFYRGPTSVCVLQGPYPVCVTGAQCVLQGPQCVLQGPSVRYRGPVRGQSGASGPAEAQIAGARGLTGEAK